MIPSAKLPAMLAAGVALIAYAITLKGTFVYDDRALLDDERYAHPGQWGRFLTESYNYGVDNLFRPIVSLSFAVQRFLTGVDAMPMHAINWILHAGVSAVVAVLAVRLTRKRDVGFVAGLLFAVIPINVEAVANIVGRAELLCALGVLGSLVIVLHGRITMRRSIAVVACLILAIGSKEQGLLIPIILMLLAVCLGVRRPRDEGERQAVLWLVLLCCFVTAAIVLYRESFLRFGWDRSLLEWTRQPLLRSRGMDVIWMPVALVGRYAALIVWPARLSIDYGGRVIGWHVQRADPYFWIGICVLLAWLAATAIAWKTKSGASLFCLLAIAVVYSLIGNFLILIGTIFGERLMYLPAAFLCILAGIVATKLPRPALITVTSVLVIAGVVRSIVYAEQWNDRTAFYLAQSDAQPLSVRLNMLVAYDQMRLGNLAAAAEADRRGRATTPDCSDIWAQSGEIAIEQKRFDEAARFLDQSMALPPGMAAIGLRQKLGKARAATRTAELFSSPASATKPATR